MPQVCDLAYVLSGSLARLCQMVSGRSIVSSIFLLRFEATVGTPVGLTFHGSCFKYHSNTLGIGIYHGNKLAGWQVTTCLGVKQRIRRISVNRVGWGSRNSSVLRTQHRQTELRTLPSRERLPNFQHFAFEQPTNTQKRW